MRKATEAGDRLGSPTRTGGSTSRWSRWAATASSAALYESVLVRLQLYMAVNLRREAEVREPADGVHRHERRARRGGARVTRTPILTALRGHGARTYLT